MFVIGIDPTRGQTSWRCSTRPRNSSGSCGAARIVGNATGCCDSPSRSSRAPGRSRPLGVSVRYSPRQPTRGTCQAHRRRGRSVGHHGDRGPRHRSDRRGVDRLTHRRRDPVPQRRALCPLQRNRSDRSVQRTKVRHRLNLRGNRQLNHAWHVAAITQISHDTPDPEIEGPGRTDGNGSGGQRRSRTSASRASPSAEPGKRFRSEH